MFPCLTYFRDLRRLKTEDRGNKPYEGIVGLSGACKGTIPLMVSRGLLYTGNRGLYEASFLVGWKLDLVSKSKTPQALGCHPPYPLKPYSLVPATKKKKKKSLPEDINNMQIHEVTCFLLA